MKLFATKPRKILVAAASCIVLLIGVEMLVLPVLLKKVAVQTLTNFLGRSVTVQKLDFNLFAMSITAHGVQVAEPGGGDIVSADTVYADFQLRSSLVQRAFVFKEITLFNPTINVARNTKGEFNFVDLLLLDWPTKGLRADLMRIVDGIVVYRDQTLPSPFVTTLRLTARIENFSTSPDAKNTFSVSVVTEKEERLSSSGFLYFNPFRTSGVIAAENVSLKKYSPYLAQRFDLAVADGTLSARASFDMDATGDRPSVLLHDGAIAVRSLDVREVPSGAPLAGFAGLTVTGARADLIRQKAEITSVVVTGGTAALSRRPDGTYNVQHMLKPAPAASAAAASSTASTAATPSTTASASTATSANQTTSASTATSASQTTSASAAGWNIAVGVIRFADFSAAVDNIFGKETLDWKELVLTTPAVRMNPFAASVGDITLSDGRLVFIDPSFEPPVRMALTDLNVRVGGFSSENSRSANVAIHARIDAAAQLQISGESNPMTMTGNSSVRGLLQNVNLVPLSPYAGKYLGYGLTAGELSLDSTAVFQDRRLVTQNRIQIDHLTLGGRTGSKDATNLPVPLAIALLKDLGGTITLNIPIEIDLEHPALDSQKMVLDALFHPFKRTAAFPFQVLGAQFGGGGDELGYQTFATDSADLSPLETGKLDTILKGMIRWPEIVLDIEGSVDGLRDTGDLQLLAANRAKIVEDYLSRPGSVEPGRIFLVENSLQNVLRKGSRAYLYISSLDTRRLTAGR